MSLDNEPAHKKARREADRAEHEYRKCARQAETTRQILEAQCVEYMKAVEAAQLTRLHVAKSALLALTSADRLRLPATTLACNQVDVFLETLSPEREVKLVAERDRTGNARLVPLIYIPQVPLPNAFTLAADVAPDASSDHGTANVGIASAGTSVAENALDESGVSSESVVGHQKVRTRSSSVSGPTAAVGVAGAGTSLPEKPPGESVISAEPMIGQRKVAARSSSVTAQGVTVRKPGEYSVSCHHKSKGKYLIFF